MVVVLVVYPPWMKSRVLILGGALCFLPVMSIAGTLLTIGNTAHMPDIAVKAKILPPKSGQIYQKSRTCQTQPQNHPSSSPPSPSHSIPHPHATPTSPGPTPSVLHSTRGLRERGRHIPRQCLLELLRGRWKPLEQHLIPELQPGAGLGIRKKGLGWGEPGGN